jgi:glycosyltransferase involved in cell wall biosynthesis
MVDLAVIIVSWNTKALVIQAVESLLADLLSSRLQAQVVVVDSASADGTRHRHCDQLSPPSR